MVELLKHFTPEQMNRYHWEGSTTVIYTVVWRNSVVWWEGGNTALWLVENRLFLYVPSVNFQVIGSLKPITAPYFPLVIKSRNFAKRQCKLQWSTPPTSQPCTFGRGHPLSCHSRLSSGLAKFSDLMIKVKYGAVIG